MRVLVADDEEANREVMEDAIELFGHDVVTVHSGQSAIDELSKSEFDFVLIDLNMGDMGGIEVVKKFARACVDHGIWNAPWSQLQVMRPTQPANKPSTQA